VAKQPGSWWPPGDPTVEASRQSLLGGERFSAAHQTGAASRKTTYVAENAARRVAAAGCARIPMRAGIAARMMTARICRQVRRLIRATY